MADDLSGTISQTAHGPASASSDGLSVTAQPVAAQVLADQYLAAKEGASRPHRGLRLSRVRLPGQTGTCGTGD